MKNAPRKTTSESASEQANSITLDSLKTRLQTGELVSPLDYADDVRPAFHGYIALIRDEISAVHHCWRTVSESHNDGTRTRQKCYGIFPRQRGSIDPFTSVTLAFAVLCFLLVELFIAVLIGGAQ